MRIMILLLLAAIMSCRNSSEAGKEKEKHADTPGEKKTIAQIRLADLDDQPIDLGKLKGKTIFINFWATWCKPCREEMPSIQEAMKQLKDRNIEFFFASDETTEQILEFQATHSYRFNYVKVENPAELDIMALPTTFIFDPNGELIFSEMGYRKWDDEANINLILNKADLK